MSQMVMVMVALFTVCWGPIQICILLQAFRPQLRSYSLYKVSLYRSSLPQIRYLLRFSLSCSAPTDLQVKIWAHCMSYSNSSVNPVVYAFMGNNFRKAFKQAFPYVFQKRGGRRTKEQGAETDRKSVV